MMDEPIVMVPDLDVGSKIVAACAREFMLDTQLTKEIDSLAQFENITLPKEFSDKLNFDAIHRKQFASHPLAHYSNGGLEGFGKRLTRVYTAMVGLKVERGFEGSIMALWNQDLVYILGELLCYTDDVMAVRVALALEEVFLSEAIIQENVELLSSLLAMKCPRLVAKLKAEDNLTPVLFGLYRTFCNTLLSQTFGGRAILPRLWCECIKTHSLKPIIHYVTLMMERSEDAILQSYDSGRGMSEVDLLLRRTVTTLPVSTLDELFEDCKEAIRNQEHKEYVHDTRTPATWTVLSSRTAGFMRLFYPIAYGCIPEWATQHGLPPHPLPIRIFITAALWLLLFLVFRLPFNNTAPTEEYLVPAIVAAVFVLLPILPIALLYYGSEDYRPLASPLISP